MAGIARSGTAAWVPSGPTMRPFRFGEQHQPDPDPALDAGTIVGDRYKVVRMLGEGGMGRVYEAEHTFLGRRCALKLLRRDALSQPENVKRFQQEAMAASKIGHGAIVEVIDFATLPDGQVFMVMEMLQGESMEAWMERPGNLADIIPRLIEVADGLDAAHRARVIHRDIKPANIFLGRGADGSVHAKILDFGIAKMTDRGPNQLQTEAGSVLGTPYYLAPERAVGNKMDGRADLYSLGVILYELLTGTVPFEADSFVEILGKHVKAHALDPRQAAPERPIPDSIASLTMRLLAKDPESRPAGAAEVARELEQMLADDLAALRGVETGPRGVVFSSGDATQVLEEVSDRQTDVPPPPMARFAGGSAQPSPGPQLSGPSSTAAPIAPPSEDHDAGPGSRSTPAVLLLLVFAVVGAAGGLIYLELQGESPAAPAASDPIPTVAPTHPIPADEAPPSKVPVVAAPAARDADDSDAEPDPSADAREDPTGDKKAEAATGEKKPKRPRGGKPKKTTKTTEDPPPPKPPDGGPTIKDDIYED